MYYHILTPTRGGGGGGEWVTHREYSIGSRNEESRTYIPSLLYSLHS